MRLSENEIDNLRKSIKAIDADATVYLFGSRTNDLTKGGDIDLAVFSNKIGRMQKARIKDAFYKSFGEQKIDIVVFENGNDPFWQVIKDKSILLSA